MQCDPHIFLFSLVTIPRFPHVPVASSCLQKETKKANSFSQLNVRQEDTYQDKMHSAACDFESTLQSLLVGISILDWWEKGWGSIQNFPCTPV